MTDTVKKADSKQSTEKKPAKKASTRKVLSPSERVAKAEQDLRDLRKKADDANKKQADKLTDERAKKVEKRDALNTEIAEIDAKLGTLQAQPDPSSPITRANDEANGSTEAPAPADV